MDLRTLNRQRGDVAVLPRVLPRLASLMHADLAVEVVHVTPDRPHAYHLRHGAPWFAREFPDGVSVAAAVLP